MRVLSFFLVFFIANVFASSTYEEELGCLRFLETRDSSYLPWETNSFKPEFLVKNIGYVPLKNYHASVYFRIPQNKTIQKPADDWHTPESVPSLRHLGNNVWELDMHFNKHILYGGDSLTEGNVGLHLTDWSSFEKIVCGIALKDSAGKVIFGSEPSAKECLEYKQVDADEPVYTLLNKWSFKWLE
ncbi:hypothetical protein AGMMS49938_18830 [Fibrobacterales bacterium]|nr:hypothetical protein AGMMS49938_18830 [Fibrobacterales bacterium]